MVTGLKSLFEAKNIQYEGIEMSNCFDIIRTCCCLPKIGNHRCPVRAQVKSPSRCPATRALFDMNDRRSHSKLFLEIWIRQPEGRLGGNNIYLADSLCEVTFYRIRWRGRGGRSRNTNPPQNVYRLLFVHRITSDFRH